MKTLFELAHAKLQPWCGLA